MESKKIVANDAFSSFYHREDRFACEICWVQLLRLSFHGGGWCEKAFLSLVSAYRHAPAARLPNLCKNSKGAVRR